MFVKEYAKAMNPIVCGLDILQWEKRLQVWDIYSQCWQLNVNQLNVLLKDTANPLPLINGLRAGKKSKIV